MRHRKKFNHLGRKKGHRSAMLANMACSLIEHKRINTTLAKAKALKKFVEPLITKSKSDTTHNRRIVFSRIKQKNAVSELFRDVAVKVADRPGGYTRIIRLGNRLGDNAEMAMIELVDYNDTYITNKKKTTRRSRRGKKSESIEAELVEETKDVIEEAPAEEAPAEEAPAEEAPTEEAPAEEAPAEEAPAEEAPAEEAPAEEAPTEEAPAEEAPAEEAPAEEAPAEEAPAEEAPAEEAPAEEAPAEEAPAEEAPAEEAPTKNDNEEK
jgi:large subunit ribosomal protein L17